MSTSKRHYLSKSNTSTPSRTSKRLRNLPKQDYRGLDFTTHDTQNYSTDGSDRYDSPTEDRIAEDSSNDEIAETPQNQPSEYDDEDGTSTQFELLPKLPQPKLYYRKIASLIETAFRSSVEIFTDSAMCDRHELMTAYIDSLLQKDFKFKPCLYFNNVQVRSNENQIRRILFGGEAQLKALDLFVSGIIGCHDAKGNLWYFRNNNADVHISIRPRLTLPIEIREQFLAVTIKCYEYDNVAENVQTQLRSYISSHVVSFTPESTRRSVQPVQNQILTEAANPKEVADFAQAIETISACYACSTCNATCDQEKPSCGSCRKHRLQCEWLTMTEINRRRTEISCTECRERHRACDRKRPMCNMCRTRKIECQWPSDNVFDNARISTPEPIIGPLRSEPPSRIHSRTPSSSIPSMNNKRRADTVPTEPAAKKSRVTSMARSVIQPLTAEPDRNLHTTSSLTLQNASPAQSKRDKGSKRLRSKSPDSVLPSDSSDDEFFQVGVQLTRASFKKPTSAEQDGSTRNVTDGEQSVSRRTQTHQSTPPLLDFSTTQTVVVASNKHIADDVVPSGSSATTYKTSETPTVSAIAEHTLVAQESAPVLANAANRNLTSSDSVIGTLSSEESLNINSGIAPSPRGESAVIDARQGAAESHTSGRATLAGTKFCLPSSTLGDAELIQVIQRYGAHIVEDVKDADFVVDDKLASQDHAKLMTRNEVRSFLQTLLDEGSKNTQQAYPAVVKARKGPPAPETANTESRPSSSGHMSSTIPAPQATQSPHYTTGGSENAQQSTSITPPDPKGNGGSMEFVSSDIQVKSTDPDPERENAEEPSDSVPAIAASAAGSTPSGLSMDTSVTNNPGPAPTLNPLALAVPAVNLGEASKHLNDQPDIPIPSTEASNTIQPTSATEGPGTEIPATATREIDHSASITASLGDTQRRGSTSSTYSNLSTKSKTPLLNRASGPHLKGASGIKGTIRDMRAALQRRGQQREQA